MSAQAEQWRVSTIEGIFETDLETLKQWIVEGCVLPTDKVSKGKHNWIEAGRAPMLRAAFNGENPGTAVVTSVAANEPTQLSTVPAGPDHLGAVTNTSGRREDETSQTHTDTFTTE